jgi:hypothetical protein
MRRFIFPIALWLYVSLDRVLHGMANALYLGMGWEMTFIWLVSVLFVGIVYILVWSDRQQRAILLRPSPPPNGKQLVWEFCLLIGFTGFLMSGLSALQHWWQSPWVDLWFKGLYALTQVVFWSVAGLWWRDAVGFLARLWEQRQESKKALER